MFRHSSEGFHRLPSRMCSMLLKPDGSKVDVTMALLWQQELIHRMHIADRGHSKRIQEKIRTIDTER
jgi:hypothetical protein